MELADRITATLSVSVIGDHLGSFLPLKDLKTLRLVSKDWYNWSSFPLRKKENVIIRRISDIQKLVNYPDAQYRLRPYRRFTFTLPMLEGKVLSRHLNSFWAIHSSSLTCITLKNVEFCSLEIFHDILFRQTPNLKHLTFQNCLNEQKGVDALKKFDKTQEVTQTSGVTYLEVINVASALDIDVKVALYSYILKLYPKLRELRYRGEFFPYADYIYMDNILQSVIPARNADPKKFNIKELHLIDAFRFSSGISEIPMYFVETLRTLNFSLETLTLNIGWNTESTILSSLLSMYQSTLQKLDLTQAPGATAFPDFPFGIHFPNLKVFRLGDGLTETMEFLRFMPNLKILHVCGIDGIKCYFSSRLPLPDANFDTFMLYRTEQMVDMTGVRLEELKEFRFDYNCSAAQIRNRLCKWMPNVEVLTMSALEDFDGNIQAILEGWGNLKELSLRIGRRSSAKAVAKYPKLKKLKRLDLFSNSKLLVSNLESQVEHTIPDNHKLPGVQPYR